MHWQNAIKLSPVKTASRFEDIGKGFKKVTIIYPDGNGIVMITENNRHSPNERKALSQELHGFMDWEPSM